ncbi:MAG TPA: hypothetical protein VK909_09875 [Anaerolineales bacterium]|nr:hypothetical protein [Anaerolineales bacterium]
MEIPLAQYGHVTNQETIKSGGVFTSAGFIKSIRQLGIYDSTGCNFIV